MLRCISLLLADIVAKVQNRATPKISRNLISSRLHRCNTPYRPYEAPWSFLSETMWSPISPRAKRVSGSEKFWSSPQKDFFNTIGTLRTGRCARSISAFERWSQLVGASLYLEGEMERGLTRSWRAIARSRGGRGRGRLRGTVLLFQQVGGHLSFRASARLGRPVALPLSVPYSTIAAARFARMTPVIWPPPAGSAFAAP
jgi:hypothetical protein